MGEKTEGIIRTCKDLKVLKKNILRYTVQYELMRYAL